MSKELAPVNPAPVVSLTDMKQMAQEIAEGGMFGIRNAGQAMTLLLISQAEGRHPMDALRRYHIIENKPALRADAMQADFESKGAIIWHVRSDVMAAGTFFKDAKAINEAARKRAKERFNVKWEMEKLNREADDFYAKYDKLVKQLDTLAMEGEETIVRTYEDAETKGLTKNSDNKVKKNWAQSPRQMLTARCISEGVRAVNPSLIAGVYTEDEAQDIALSEQQEREAAEANTTAARESKQAEAKANVEAAVRTRQEERGEVQSGGVSESNWRDVKIHIGKANGPFLGKTIGELVDLPLKKAVALVDWLVVNWLPQIKENATAFGVESISEQDKQLANAVQFASKYVDSLVEDAKAKAAAETKPAPPVEQPEVLPKSETLPPTKTAEAKPAPPQLVEEKETVTETADWRTVTIPFTCSVKGRQLDSFDNVAWLEAVRKQLLDKESVAKTVDKKTLGKFTALYELAWSDCGLDRDKNGVLELLREKLKPTLTKHSMKESVAIAVAVKLDLLPNIEPQPKVAHFANYDEETLRNVLYKLPSLIDELDKTAGN